MKTNTIRGARRAFLLGAALSITAPLAAQSALPPADQLVARHVEAIGGRDAVLRPSSFRTTGTFEMPAAGMSARLEVITARPGRISSSIDIPGLGAMRSGYDGEVGWSLDPIMGARILTGGELDAMTDQANPLAMVRDASLFSSMETIERAEIGGETCYKVRLVWNTGRQSYDCYSAESGLLVATIASQESPMGTVEATSHFSDFREFGGVRYATRMVQRAMGQEQIMTVNPWNSTWPTTRTSSSPRRSAPCATADPRRVRRGACVWRRGGEGTLAPFSRITSLRGAAIWPLPPQEPSAPALHEPASRVPAADRAPPGSTDAAAHLRAAVSADGRALHRGGQAVRTCLS